MHDQIDDMGTEPIIHPARDAFVSVMSDTAAAIEELEAEVRKYHDAFGRLSKTAVELEQRIAELKGVKPQEVQE